MFVKICGIKDVKTAEFVCEQGADAIGIVAYPKSKRYVTVKQAEEIAEAVAGRCPIVIVSILLADCLPYKRVADYFQADDANISENCILAGSSEPSGVFKYFLFDDSKGAGTATEYPEWVDKYRDKLILAGGLIPESVEDVINKYRPFGVDVSSGVETEGVKDFEKIKRFIGNARGKNVR
jgi:phosphoribosylanthranilate isomerase